MIIIPNKKQIVSDFLLTEVTNQFNQYLKENINTPVEFDYSGTSYNLVLSLPKLAENAKVFTVTAIGKDVRIDQHYTKFDGSSDLYKTLITFLKQRVN